jgi:capsular polysaccharide transport system permease protein
MKLSPPTRPSEPLATSGITPPGPRILRPAAGSGRGKKIGLRGWFLLLVVAPTLLVGAYFYGFAANIYESETRFLVRNRNASSGSSSAADLAGGASRLAALFPTSRGGSEEGRAVASYIDSHAAVAALRRNIDIVELWRRPEADAIARLWWQDPQAEWLLWYYRSHVRVTLDPDTGVMLMRARAFRPADAQDLTSALLVLAEQLVNTLSSRTITDALRAGQEELTRAEVRMVAAREALIAFREREQAFDPQRSAVGAQESIGRFEAALAQARADLQERRSFMRPDNPQVQLLQNRIEALQAQIATERGRATRGGEALTQQVASFERLELERMLADRQLASATASLEMARAEAIRQQTFVVRVAEPHLPEAALFPRASYNTFTVFISLSVLFGIGWLLVVSAREHAN